jgi:hypothetical protein
MSLRGSGSIAPHIRKFSTNFWLASHPGCFMQREIACSTHCVGEWVGPTANQDTVGKRKQVLEELIVCFPLIWHTQTALKLCLQKLFSWWSLYWVVPSNHRRYIGTHVRQFFYSCIFVALEMCLLIHFLAMEGGHMLPNLYLAMAGGIHMQTHAEWWEGFMKYAVEMGSGAMM